MKERLTWFGAFLVWLTAFLAFVWVFSRLSGFEFDAVALPALVGLYGGDFVTRNMASPGIVKESRELLALRVKLTEQALRVFRTDAPVCLCTTPQPCRRAGHSPADMCAPQLRAMKAMGHLVSVGFEFSDGLVTALNHAHAGEGREEFDSLVADGVVAPK